MREDRGAGFDPTFGCGMAIGLLIVLILAIAEAM